MKRILKLLWLMLIMNTLFLCNVVYLAVPVSGITLYNTTNGTNTQIYYSNTVMPKIVIKNPNITVGGGGGNTTYYYYNTSEIDPLFTAENVSLWNQAKNKYNATYNIWAYNQSSPFYTWLTTFHYNYNETPTSGMLDRIYGCAEGKILKRGGSVWECSDDQTGGNFSWNETRANGLYAGIIWAYNETNACISRIETNLTNYYTKSETTTTFYNRSGGVPLNNLTGADPNACNNSATQKVTQVDFSAGGFDIICIEENEINKNCTSTGTLIGYNTSGQVICGNNQTIGANTYTVSTNNSLASWINSLFFTITNAVTMNTTLNSRINTMFTGQNNSYTSAGATVWVKNSSAKWIKVICYGAGGGGGGGTGGTALANRWGGSGGGGGVKAEKTLMASDINTSVTVTVGTGGTLGTGGVGGVGNNGVVGGNSSFGTYLIAYGGGGGAGGSLAMASGGGGAGTGGVGSVGNAGTANGGAPGAGNVRFQIGGAGSACLISGSTGFGSGLGEYGGGSGGGTASNLAAFSGGSSIYGGAGGGAGGGFALAGAIDYTGGAGGNSTSYSVGTGASGGVGGGNGANGANGTSAWAGEGAGGGASNVNAGPGGIGGIGGTGSGGGGGGAGLINGGNGGTGGAGSCYVWQW